jgi:hypothetical protein
LVVLAGWKNGEERRTGHELQNVPVGAPRSGVVRGDVPGAAIDPKLLLGIRCERGRQSCRTGVASAKHAIASS